MNRKLLTTALLVAFASTFVVGTQAAEMGADRHVKKGIQCEMCHGAKKEIDYPSIDQCVKCHDPQVVADKTKNVKPRNPHVSPHYGNKLDCALCHIQHAQPENYCDQCHKFGFKVP